MLIWPITVSPETMTPGHASPLVCEASRESTTEACPSGV